MIVTPFPKPFTPAVAFSYHGSCEHTLLTECDLSSSFSVTVDFFPSNLVLQSVGVRLGDGTIVVGPDMDVTTNNFDSVISIEDGTELLDSVVTLTAEQDQVSISLDTVGVTVTLMNITANGARLLLVNATDYDKSIGDLCGLCGSLTGTLLFSDKVTSVGKRNKMKLEEFAASWLVNPGDNVIGEQSKECGEAVSSVHLNQNVFGKLLS